MARERCQRADKKVTTTGVKLARNLSLNLHVLRNLAQYGRTLSERSQPEAYHSAVASERMSFGVSP